MTKTRVRGAVAPLRRHSASGLSDRMPSVDAIARHLRPPDPVVCLRPRTLAATARRFIFGFPGDVLYAVKCNPEPAVLRALWQGGIRHFDCASLGEIRLVRQMFPTATIHYMHPIKPDFAIREAYSAFGVRDFSLDSHDELEKLVAATDGATDLGLLIRFAPPRGHSVYELSGKFGASPAVTQSLLRAARPVAARLGLCFHVGSQCMEPETYARAIDAARDAVIASGVPIDILDIGGGFPVSYPDMVPPSLDAYFAAIAQAFSDFPGKPALWAEPGRALVAAGASLVVRVDARRGDVLHINDGVFGSLYDAGTPRWRFPARLIGRDEPASGDLLPFSFYGPSCDSADFMAGPFLLPADTRVGDLVELGQLGAYGTCLRTGFNGFDRALIVEVGDQPLLVTPGHAAPVPIRQRRAA